MNPSTDSTTVDPEKGPEAQRLLAPPLSPTGGYHAVYYNYLETAPQDRPRNVRRRRFWHFFACTVLFVTVLHLLSPRHWVKRAGYWGRWGDHGHSGDWQCAESVNWTGSQNGPDHPFHARTSFTLPLDSKELHFLAEGGLSRGSYEISQTADADQDTAIVDIDVAYFHPDALADATVCRIRSGDEGWGLGIFTPRSWPHDPHHDHVLRFHVHLRLPSSSPLVINKLTTNLPLFAHHLPEFGNSVFFNEISLKTTNAPIKADSLAGNVLQLRSSNGAIHGSFNTSKSLELRTSNAPIGVHADLYNDDESATTIVLKTSNGRINSDVALVSSTSDGQKGQFEVEARTSNAPLELTVVDAPVDSVLKADAHTSNSPARVTLHKTYEGTFHLASSAFFRPSVEWDNDVEDPAGRGRTRKVSVDSIRGGVVRGSAAWGDKGEGKVDVETSNSPLHLIL